MIVLLIGTLLVGLYYLKQGLFSIHDPGHVLIGYGTWVIEATLYSALFVLAVSFVVFYFVLRTLGYFFRLPKRIKQQASLRRKFELSYESLADGLIDSAAGKWEEAEKSLIRHAANSGKPLIHYLSAAKAAQSRGALAERNEYLKLAHQSSPGSELIVGLTEAQLQLSDREFAKALESLTVLRSIAPGHGSVLRLLHETYRHLEDWAAIRKLLPDLSKNRVMREAEIKRLESETYSGLLKKAASSKNPEAIAKLWSEIPAHIKRVPGMNTAFYAAMIDAGAGSEIENSLRKDLDNDWNETLLGLYGCVQSENPKRQLARAERWVAKHSRDGLLFRTLAKLCLRIDKREKAEIYLRSSVELDPSVDAYRLLGEILSEKGEKDKALENFHKGLLFASDEVVRQIDNHAGATEELPTAQAG
ncbi:MAG: heme biosynthesis HemY N-terminal domain-containing protein [Methylococcales bacterium]